MNLHLPFIIGNFSDDTLFSRSPFFNFFFVIGAIFGLSGIALLLISIAGLFAREEGVRIRPVINVIAWIVLVSSLVVGSAYLYEIIAASRSSDPYERYSFFRARFGHGYYQWIYWGTLCGQLLIPQLLWFRRVRTQFWFTLIIALVLLAAMNYERVVIYFTARNQDFIPSSWHEYHP